MVSPISKYSWTTTAADYMPSFPSPSCIQEFRILRCKVKISGAILCILQLSMSFRAFDSTKFKSGTHFALGNLKDKDQEHEHEHEHINAIN